MKRNFFNSSRVVLLVEIERYCEQTDCLQLNRVGLTRADAGNYSGFQCERCESWNDDSLKLSDVPADWRQVLEKELTGETAA